ncbi:MAG: hypothetical protein ACREWG_07820, partial [Gammaproteobacteria bacterium]
VLYYPIIPLAAYLFYEFAYRTSPDIDPQPGDVRLDLVLIWPFLVIMGGRTWYRWMKLRTREGLPPVTASSERAAISFIAGVLGFVVPYYLVCPLMAVYFGYQSMAQADAEDYRGKKLAGLGFISGVTALFFGGLKLFGVFTPPI